MVRLLSTMTIALAAANPDVIPVIQVNRRKLQDEEGWWVKIQNYFAAEENQQKLIQGGKISGGALLVAGAGYGIWSMFFSSSPPPVDENGQEDNEEIDAGAEEGQENSIEPAPGAAAKAGGMPSEEGGDQEGEEGGDQNGDNPVIKKDETVQTDDTLDPKEKIDQTDDNIEEEEEEEEENVEENNQDAKELVVTDPSEQNDDSQQDIVVPAQGLEGEGVEKEENPANGQPQTTIIAGAAGREEDDTQASGGEDLQVDPAVPVQEKQDDDTVRNGDQEEQKDKEEQQEQKDQEEQPEVVNAEEEPIQAACTCKGESETIAIGKAAAGENCAEESEKCEECWGDFKLNAETHQCICDGDFDKTKGLCNGKEDDRQKAWKAELEARVTATGASSTGLLGTALILLAMF